MDTDGLADLLTRRAAVHHKAAASTARVETAGYAVQSLMHSMIGNELLSIAEELRAP
jgi:hypothetical protein